MSILTYPLGFIGGGKEFYNNVMENSIKTESQASLDYLEYTIPSTADNYTTWTFSWWMKRSEISTSNAQWIWGTMPGTNHNDFLINANDKLYFEWNNAGVSPSAPNSAGSSDMVFRDVNKWYHCVFVWDSNNGLQADRSRLYVNGERKSITQSSGHSLGDKSYGFAGIGSGTNASNFRLMGYYFTTSQQAYHWNGYMTDIYAIDGYALGPENFGEYKEGVWIPKAYAGPPPIITDSSSSNHALENRDGKAKLEYDEKYIGDSSIDLSATTTTTALVTTPQGSELNMGTGDFSFDCWFKVTSSSAIFHFINTGTGGASPTKVWNFMYHSTFDNLVFFTANHDGTSGADSISDGTVDPALNQWHHAFVGRESGNVTIFIDGIPDGTTYDASSHDYATTEVVIGGRDGSGTEYSVPGLMDEIRLVKGEYLPPRFYFGTTYGDASGGVLPQRATSAHRFTDDERTTLLISGQSANVHARALSLVDESGRHIDNVHFSNSTITTYPTQDGVGKQFTMSGPQHTTREAFIGNTSSIVFDGIDDYLKVDRAGSDHGFPTGNDNRTVDFWVKQNDPFNVADWIFGYGTGNADQAFGVSKSSTTVAKWRFQGWGSPADFDTTATIEDAQWQHIHVAHAPSDTKMYVDGVLHGSGTRALNTTAAPAFQLGSFDSTYAGVYIDEFRVLSTTEKPQIKWTHTQTAGAGNKDAYDIHGWRAHGHEFTDDNATSLLIHGDDYENITANSFFFDGTNDYVTTDTLATTGATYTWACWFKPLKYTDSEGILFDNDSDFIIAVREGSISHYNYDTGNGDGVRFSERPINFNKWNLAVVTKDDTGLIRWYVNGVKDSSKQQASPTRIISGAYDIGSRSSGPYSFKGYIAALGIWSDHEALSDANILAMYNSGPTTDWRTSYSTNLVNYWAFGNLTTDHLGATELDTSSAIYDRTASNKNITTVSGAVFISDGGDVRVFKDSSSANSIHHATLSGDGVHHSKAVTLKSDGTNGTSTTDRHGNTIYWAGSNSTVTFANSSSFNYGNTAMAFDNGHILSIADHADFVWQADGMTVDGWAYINDVSDAGGGTTVHHFVSQVTSGQGSYFHVRHDKNYGLVAEYKYDASGTAQRINLYSDTGDWDQAVAGHAGPGWHHFSLVTDSSDLFLYQDGILIQANTTNSTTWTLNSTGPFEIGGGTNLNANEDLNGYLDEVRFVKGGAHPPRFYLGNQAPESGASFTTVKTHNFDGQEYMTADDPFSASLSNREIVMWFQNHTAGTDASYIINNINSSSYTNGFYLYRMANNLRVASFNSSPATAHYSDNIPFLHTGLQHLVVQIPDDVTSEDCKVYINGNLVYNTTLGSSAPDSYGSVSDDKLRIAYTSSTIATVDMVQLACYEGTFHTAAEVKSMFDLGPTGNLLTSFSPNMVSYHGFSNLDAVNALTTSAATADTVSTVYDRKPSGTARNFTQSTTDSQPTIRTFYYPSNSAKRLTHGPLIYDVNPTSNTAILGNTHYANTLPQSVSSNTFGSFVDDEYTVLLLRGGHSDGNTVFFDSNTAAGETITFPAHSHSYGKSRVAKGGFTPSGTVRHDTTNQLGLHGSSIHFPGTTSDKMTITHHEDFDFGTDDFCVEFWYRPYSSGQGYSSAGGIFLTNTNTSGIAAINMWDNGSEAQLYDNASARMTWIPTYDAYNHIAVQRRGNTNYLFHNGICRGTYDSSTLNYTCHADGLLLGMRYYDSPNQRLKMEFDELRITKGICRYTPDGVSVSGIVPSTATGAGSTGSSIPTMPYLRPTPYVEADGNRGYFGQGNVKLLVRSDTYPGDTNFTDSSASFGQNEVDGDFIKSIISKTSSASRLATIDRWQGNDGNQTGKIIAGGGFSGGNALKITRVTGSYSNFYYPITNLNIGATYVMSAYVTHGGGTTGLTESPQTTYNFYAGPNPGTDNYSSPALTGTTSNAWVRIRDTFVATAATGWVALSRHNDGTAGSIYFSDVKVTPSLSPKLITNISHTAENQPIIKTANSITDYALSGGADGIFFDGTNDYLVIPFHKQIQFGQGGADFTFETWIYANDGAAHFYLLDTRDGTSPNNLYMYYDYNNDSFIFQDGVGSYHWRPPDIIAAKWQHIGIQKRDGEYAFLRNGVMETPDTDNSLTPTSSKGRTVTWINNLPLHIGAQYDGTSAFEGYLDEIRISNMARYTGQGLIDSDFPNPSTEFGIQTEGTTYGQLDEQVTANTTYQRYNYQHRSVKTYDFDGANDFIDAGSDAGTDQEGTMYQAYATWFKTDGEHSGTAMLCLIGDSGFSSGTNYAYWLNIAGTGGGTAELGTLASSSEPTAYGWAQIRSTQRYDDGKWHLAMLIHDSNQFARIYADGILVAETTAVCASSPTTGELNSGYFHGGFHIGDQSATSYEFKGRIGNVARWKYSSSSALNTKWTDSAIRDLYLEGLGANWATNHNSDMTQYYAMGTHTGGLAGATEDSASTVYDRRTSGTAFNGVGTSMEAPSSDTKLLIHSNTDIDGDTSILDSSGFTPGGDYDYSKNTLIRRASIGGTVPDPKYANSGVNRSSLVGATYNGIYFNGNTDNDRLSFGKADPDTGNLGASEDHTFALWYYTTYLADNRGIIHMGYSDADYVPLRTSGTTDFVAGDDSTAIFSGNHGISIDTWYHLAVTRSGTTVTVYRDGTALSGTGTGTSAVATVDGELTLNWFNQSPHLGYAYFDQFMFIRGSALTTAQLGHLVGGGTVGNRAANTHFGALGGLIAHEEYANTTTTANTRTVALLHSNNATHHSQGSRKFYNDIVNTAFYGAGTFSATPAAAPKGHEAAGYFVVTAASGQYKFQGNTHSSTIDQNPQLRLRRGYSYIFDFSDGTNSGHQFYFANSTANSTGYAYGSGGTSGARPNAHLTGLFGTNTDPNGAPAVTWTQLTATNYGDNSGTGDAYKYIKYEVPTDGPKNLYYRCSPHSTMGNAIFVMEATEPSPVKVYGLPSLKTSGWNDRDYTGIGTNNSVMHFDGTNWLDIGDSADLTFGTGEHAVEFWFKTNSVDNTTQNLWSQWGSGTMNYSLYIQYASAAGGFSFRIYQEGNVPSNNTTFHAYTADGAIKVGQWYHIVFTRVTTSGKLYINGKDSNWTISNAITASDSFVDVGTHNIGRRGDGNNYFIGEIDSFMLFKGSAHTANTVIQNYMNGRAGVHNTANSSCVLHVKADSTYGDTTFTDASPSSLTITNNGGVYHHIEDDRTANTALYFDKTSYIKTTSVSEVAHGAKPFTYECWFKPTEAYASGQGVLLDTRSANPGAGYYIYLITQDLKWYDNTTVRTIADNIDMHVWHHVAITNFNTDGGKARAFLDGVCKLEVTSAVTSYSNNVISIGRDNPGSNHYYQGYMDGIRITNGMPRYTSGIPTDGQSPAKDYDDGRSSNVSNPSWATSSTRRYYGINTHTYLQTTEYATDANTVLLIRGDDAQTANDGVNMYGDNGFHLEFKEVGSGEERDYNNFNTGVNGLGSDTSATQEFADDATVFLLRSRPNQANGSAEFINEVDQSRLSTGGGSIHHNEAQNIFSVDANTANVSVSSGGSGTY